MRKLTVRNIKHIELAIELVEEAQKLVDRAVSGTNEERRYLAHSRYGFNRLLRNTTTYDYCLKSIIIDSRQKKERKYKERKKGEIK